MKKHYKLIAALLLSAFFAAGCKRQRYQRKSRVIFQNLICMTVKMKLAVMI